MISTKDPLLILNNIRKEDKNIVALFVFGSFVSKKDSHRSYREIRIFDGKEFLLSRFKLRTIVPDIDVLCVSKKPSKTVEIIRRCGEVLKDHYLTINVTSQDVFEEDVVSEQPKAIKRILLFRELLVVKGGEYLEPLKVRADKASKPADKAFQDEFDFRKEYLGLFAKNNVSSLTITRDEYEKLFPNFLKFIAGEMDGGFPEKREKLVIPQQVGLKVELDISTVELKELR